MTNLKYFLILCLISALNLYSAIIEKKIDDRQYLTEFEENRIVINENINGSIKQLSIIKNQNPNNEFFYDVGCSDYGKKAFFFTVVSTINNQTFINNFSDDGLQTSFTIEKKIAPRVLYVFGINKILFHYWDFSINDYETIIFKLEKTKELTHFNEYKIIQIKTIQGLSGLEKDIDSFLNHFDSQQDQIYFRKKINGKSKLVVFDINKDEATEQKYDEDIDDNFILLNVSDKYILGQKTLPDNTKKIILIDKNQKKVAYKSPAIKKEDFVSAVQSKDGENLYFLVKDLSKSEVNLFEVSTKLMELKKINLDEKEKQYLRENKYLGLQKNKNDEIKMGKFKFESKKEKFTEEEDCPDCH